MKHADPAPRLAEALPIYVKIGLLSFGGPAGQIALMQGELVERRGWVPAASFDRGLAFSMMLPGPEAQQLATWLGWRLHGLKGGIAAGLAFILPGMALMIGLAWVAAAHGAVPWVAAIFAGIQPVVIAVVLQAMRKLSGRALGSPWHWALAVAAFAAIWGLGAPFPLIVALAALAGLALPHGAAEAPAPDAPRGLWRHFLATLLGFALLILGVFGASLALFGTEPVLDVAELFLTAAFVTFGGAYAVLPFVADQAVESYGWLTPAEMLNGLAIAEATPGPLILVNTYAGFFAGWTGTESAGLGVAAALLATFYTFAPSFMLILAFAPAVERLHRIGWARRALAGVSAAVVGVIANLAVYLGEAAFLPAGPAAPDWAKIVLFAVALPLVFWWRIGVLWLVAGGCLAGLGLHAAGLL
ncbi:chromate efflux transporter [Paralimibaculum aggregatum]|uniref:Chromate efflux transporter n=1 Tax=Paralimibaculum aggregatum TaxID=3036245 RepID=A0ABQ6LN06_9RHOB|nr:chromate efflux transporter [Limibaculum sp. NKW23]GMG84372.1 chromate efflux transporter [Limibaculum sp. NKW23]